MGKMIAYCGLVCTDCQAYLATQADDRDALQRVADQWADGQIDKVMCDGCKATTGRIIAYCTQCAIRPCAIERGHDTCAACAEMDDCAKLAAFLEHATNAKATLEVLRAGG